MEARPTTSSTIRFATRPRDPRLTRTRRYALLDGLTLARWAVRCGADSWGAVARCGHAHASRPCPGSGPRPPPAACCWGRDEAYLRKALAA